MQAERLMEPPATRQLKRELELAVRKEEYGVDNIEQLRGLKKFVPVAYLEGEKYVRHDNPDNTVGGFVHAGIKVPEDVYIDENTIVMKGAVLGRKVRLHEQVTVCEGAEIGENTLVLRCNMIAPHKRIPANLTIRPGSNSLRRA